MTTTTSLLDALSTIFREVFDDESIELRPETESADIADWDSVAQVKLVLAIEERFGIQFTTEEVGGTATVARFLQALAKRGIAE
jgi:acyl carrier protein